MWRNVVQHDRPQMAIWRMLIACWIPKATNTHSEYAILLVHDHNVTFIRSLPVWLQLIAL